MLCQSLVKNFQSLLVPQIKLMMRSFADILLFSVMSEEQNLIDQNLTVICQGCTAERERRHSECKRNLGRTI